MLGCDGKANTETPFPPNADQLLPGLRRAFGIAARIVQANPDDVQAWGRLGALYLANGYSPLAVRCLEQATSRAPGEAQWWFYLSLAYVDVGQPEPALSAMRKAAEIDATRPCVDYRFGSLLLNVGRTEEARSAFGQLQQAHALHPAGWVGSALAAIQEGEQSQAIEALEIAAQLAPTDSYPQFLLGSISSGNRGAAPEPRPSSDRSAWCTCDWDVALATEMARNEMEQATVLAKAGKNAEAIRVLETLLARDPGNRLALRNLALVYTAAGDRDRACTLLEKVLELDPEDTPALLNLGLLEYERGNFDAALRRLDALVAVRPDWGHAHEVRGRVLYGAGDTNGALAAFRLAAEHGSENPQLQEWLGKLEYGVQNWKGAESALLRAVQNDPGNGELVYALAISQFKQAKIAEALATIAGAPPEARTKELSDLSAALQQIR